MVSHIGFFWQIISIANGSGLCCLLVDNPDLIFFSDFDRLIIINCLAKRFCQGRRRRRKAIRFYKLFALSSYFALFLSDRKIQGNCWPFHRIYFLQIIELFIFGWLLLFVHLSKYKFIAYVDNKFMIAWWHVHNTTTSASFIVLCWKERKWIAEERKKQRDNVLTPAMTTTNVQYFPTNILKEK